MQPDGCVKRIPDSLAGLLCSDLDCCAGLLRLKAMQNSEFVFSADGLVELSAYFMAILGHFGVFGALV
jgi:hypothetical protein